MHEKNKLENSLATDEKKAKIAVAGGLAALP